jgi:hypothetical protein
MVANIAQLFDCTNLFYIFFGKGGNTVKIRLEQRRRKCKSIQINIKNQEPFNKLINYFPGYPMLPTLLPF